MYASFVPTRIRVTLLTGTIALLAAAPVRAALFEIDVQNGAFVGRGNDVVSLIDSLLDQTDAFAGLSGMPAYTATLDYLGVQDAVRLDLSNFGRALTLTIPSTGEVVAFTGATPSDLENQVESWLEQDGARAWAEFLQAINARSPLALLDGNPRATTALMANSAFRRFGLHDEGSRLGYGEQEVARFASFGIKVQVAGGRVDTPGFGDLSSVDGSIELAGDFGETLGLSFAVIGQLRDYEGAEIYDAGVELGLPIRIVRPVDDSNLYWALTPVLQVAAGASTDLAAGGLFVGGGLVNSVALELGPIEVGMGNQLVYYGGVPIDDIGGYDFRTELDQLVMKNGAKLGFHPVDLVYAEAGLVFTNFLVDAAAVDFYTTPYLSVALRLGRHAELRGSYEADLGKNDYRANRGRLELGLAF